MQYVIESNFIVNNVLHVIIPRASTSNILLKGKQLLKHATQSNGTYSLPNSVHVYQDAYQGEIKVAKYKGQSYEMMMCIAYTKMLLLKRTLTAIQLMARLCVCKNWSVHAYPSHICDMYMY